METSRVLSGDMFQVVVVETWICEEQETEWKVIGKISVQPYGF
jgi:hypothetical protein